MATPAEGLARMRAAAASGALDELCLRHGVRVLTVFGMRRLDLDLPAGWDRAT